MAFKFRSIKKKEVGTSLSEINVTPLVDVMLVLLIIFMVTAPMMHSGIGIGLAISITADRYIHIKDQVINQFLLEQKLKEYFYGQTKKIVYIRADESLPYGYFIHILDIIKKAGVESVGLVAEPPKKDKK